MADELKEIILKNPELLNTFIKNINYETIILFLIDLIKLNINNVDTIFINYINILSTCNNWDFCKFFELGIIKKLTELNIKKYKKYINIIIDNFSPLFIETDDDSDCIEIINSAKYFKPILLRIINFSYKKKDYISDLINFVFLNRDQIDDNIIKMIFIKCENKKTAHLYFKKAHNIDAIFTDFLLSARTKDLRDFLFERIFTEMYKINNHQAIFNSYEEFYNDIHIMKKYLKKIKVYKFTHVRLKKIFIYYQNQEKNTIPFIKLIIKISIKLKLTDFIDSELNKMTDNKYYIQLGNKTDYTKFIL